MSLLLVASGSPPVTIVDDDTGGSRAGAAFVAIIAAFAPYVDDPVPTAIAASIVDEQSTASSAPHAWAPSHAQGSGDDLARITVTDDAGRQSPSSGMVRLGDPAADDVAIATIKDDSPAAHAVAAPQISIPSAWSGEDMATVIVATFVDEPGAIDPRTDRWIAWTSAPVNADEIAALHLGDDAPSLWWSTTADAAIGNPWTFDDDIVAALVDDDPSKWWTAFNAPIYAALAFGDDDDIAAPLVDDDHGAPHLTVEPPIGPWIALDFDEISPAAVATFVDEPGHPIPIVDPPIAPLFAIDADDLLAPRVSDDDSRLPVLTVDPLPRPWISIVDEDAAAARIEDDSWSWTQSTPWGAILEGIGHAFALDTGDALPAPFRGEQLARESVTAHWLVNWPALQPSVPYTFDNESFDDVDAFVRFGMVHTTRAQITAGPVGHRRFESRGYVFAQLFSAVNAGRAAMSSLVDSARAVLDGTRIAQVDRSEPVTTRGAAVRELGEDGRWSMAIVTVPFVWFETR